MMCLVWLVERDDLQKMLKVQKHILQLYLVVVGIRYTILYVIVQINVSYWLSEFSLFLNLQLNIASCED